MSIIKQRLAEGKKVRIFGIGAIASHKLIELVGSLGCYDGVWIDQEHAGLSQTQIEVLVLACRAARLDAYVRLTASDYATVMRPYEAGASGVMAAQVRTIAEVKQLVAWAKFPPLGVRGMNMGNWKETGRKLHRNSWPTRRTLADGLQCKSKPPNRSTSWMRSRPPMVLTICLSARLT